MSANIEVIATKLESIGSLTEKDTYDEMRYAGEMSRRLPWSSDHRSQSFNGMNGLHWD